MDFSVCEMLFDEETEDLKIVTVHFSTLRFSSGNLRRAKRRRVLYGMVPYHTWSGLYDRYHVHTYARDQLHNTVHTYHTWGNQRK